MAVLTWDGQGDRLFETGVDQGVLYIPTAGVYDTAVPWNGLTAVTESPSGAEASPQYADNKKYLNLVSAEDFGGTIEAFTYPDEFLVCDGSVSPDPGVVLGQQSRSLFGLSYRTRIGNDVDGDAHGYKIHVVYNCLATPSERAYSTVNDSPEAMTFSWDFTTTPIAVTGYKDVALITFDSTKLTAGDWTAITEALYGTASTEASLPDPDTLLALITGV